MKQFVNRDFVENFIRLHKKELIKVGAGVLVFVMAFVTLCIRNDDKQSKELVLAQADGMQIVDEGNEAQLKKDEELELQGIEKENDSLQKVIYVDVSGAVKKPNVYELEEGSRVYNAIDLAGGFSEDADYSNLNLAQVLKDQDKITVSTKEELKGENNKEAVTNGKWSGISNAESSSTIGSVDGDMININTANSEELQNLSGIGPSTAEKIIDYRTQNGKFNTIEEIMNVSGIGQKTFAKFKDRITV